MGSVGLKLDGLLKRLLGEITFLLLTAIGSYFLFTWLNPAFWRELLGGVTTLIAIDSIPRVFHGDRSGWPLRTEVLSRIAKIVIGVLFAAWMFVAGYSMIQGDDGSSTIKFFVPLGAIVFVGWQIWKLIRLKFR